MVLPRALVFRVLFKLKQKFSKVSIISGHVLKCSLTDRAILEFIIFFRGHGNESCNLIGSLPGQYFPISAHGPR